MKRTLLSVVVIFLFGFAFAACGPSDNGNSDAAGVVAILEEAGYTLNSYDNETHEYFAGQVQTNYGITIVVVDMYQGYIIQGADQTRFVRVIACQTAAQATSYYDALVAEDEEGIYLYKTGTVVVYTGSEATKNLFN